MRLSFVRPHKLHTHYLRPFGLTGIVLPPFHLVRKGTISHLHCDARTGGIGLGLSSGRVGRKRCGCLPYGHTNSIHIIYVHLVGLELFSLPTTLSGRTRSAILAGCMHRLCWVGSLKWSSREEKVRLSSIRPHKLHTHYLRSFGLTGIARPRPPYLPHKYF